MPAPVAPGLKSYRRQSLLTEFASLKHVQPQGIYVSLTPGDPSLWSGVLFVREGPYAPAVLRFRINFPSTYPHTAPLVTFNTDVFHPLLFDATRSSQNSGSTFDDGSERPPPGALSLRHGFACWRTKVVTGSLPQTQPSPPPDSTLPQNKPEDTDVQEMGPEFADVDEIYVVDILRYMRSAFEDASLIDAVPFEEAANQSAWYAWRACKHSQFSKETSLSATVRPASPPVTNEATAKDGAPSTPAKNPRTAAVATGAGSTPKVTPKKPSEWKWDGVWEMRARKGIESSVTEASLFGASGLRDDEIHFVSVDPEEVEGMRAELHAHLRSP